MDRPVGGRHRKIQQERGLTKLQQIDLIETFLRAGNLTVASRKLIRNKGAAGIDKMNVKELKRYLDDNPEALTI
ncbi:MAG: hypothetical protein K9H64_08145 [Bacteroidales bacterium]|nr:hypothetical protein [Bacteroidales bacterium]MCF8455801.1 hypothetical protein [Bacteroidales bacterium]